MTHKFTDFSQLKKGMFKPIPTPVEKKAIAPVENGASRDEDVLEYFSRGGVGGKQESTRISGKGTDLTLDGAEALRLQLRDSEAARTVVEAKLKETERNCAKKDSELAAAQKEIARLKGECGRLQGEFKKLADKTPQDGNTAPAEPTVAPARETPTKGVLTAPSGFVEAFPGETREMILSVLSEARDSATQSIRERRAAVLDAVLATNPSTGELARRRAELKQAMKDAGAYTDPNRLAALGFKLVSGRTHWKLEYAGVRMPIAKTPSDYRANLNIAADMANRCF